MIDGLPEPIPASTRETEPFWAATAEGRLLLKKCDACLQLIWYPRNNCPFCMGRATSWVQVRGTGSIYSFTVVYRGEGEYAGAVPYALAYVELDEGPRLMTNIVDTDLEVLRIGQRVDLVFAGPRGEPSLPRFTVASAGCGAIS